MKTYRIQEFATRSGTTVKALRYYDRIGLLKPGRTIAGYRFYGDSDLERVDRIAAFKCLGLPLREIKGLLGDRSASLPSVLRAHRETLERRRRAFERAIHVIAHTERLIERGGRSLVPQVLVRAVEMETGLRPPRSGQPVIPPPRVNPSRLALFHEIAATLDTPLSNECRRALIARWDALLDAETGGDEETKRAMTDAVTRRGEWPEGVRQYVAALYETDWMTFDRVARYVRGG